MATQLRFSKRFLSLAPALLALTALPGCFGVSANPLRIGNLPTGDIIRTHAKPPLRGFYHNFDPKARTLTITPIECTAQTGTQRIFIATVCDQHGNGLRNRRVEWHVDGVGHIVEVDESGLFPGRGYLVDNRYAVSYTNYQRHTITRGNDDPTDDVHLLPGQTWCVVTSAAPGATHVTCYAPGIYNWEEHKVFASVRWTDVEAIFPDCAVNAAGTPHVFTTRLRRALGGAPAAGVRVRYRVLDGPPAVLDPGGAPVIEVLSDPQGNATATLRQLQPTAGANHIAIEVLGGAGSSAALEVLDRTQITKTWVAPQLGISKSGPPSAAVGQPITYQITVVNTGSVATRGVTLRDTLAPTLQLLGSTPPAVLQGTDLIWRFPLAPQQSSTVQFQCMPTQAGTVTNCAEAVADEGFGGRSCVTTQIVSGALAVAKTGPATAVVGQPVTFQIAVTNQGNGPAANVIVTDTFEPAFVHATGGNPVRLTVGTLAPGETRSVPIELVARAPGTHRNRVTAQADGGLLAAAEHTVTVTQPQLSILKTGPKLAMVGVPFEFQVRVKNTGNSPATSVMVQDQLPTPLAFASAAEGAAVQGNTALWNLGTLAPGEERTLRLPVVAQQAGTNVCNFAVVSADGGVQQQSPPACLDIKGVPALLTELIDRMDPVPLGGETTYAIQITNTGSDVANGVVLTCILPKELEFVDAEGEGRAELSADKRTIKFGPFDNMEPRKRLIFQVQAKALAPGDVRFEIQVSAGELSKPVVDQESTRIFDPQAPNG